MRRHQIPGSAIRGPKFGKSYASGPGTSDVTPTCNLLPAGTCMKIGTLVLPGDMQVRQLLREPSIPNPSTPKDGMPMRPDVPLYLIWYLQRSGDMVTLDGETFLDLQEAPHQAEASTLDKQSGVYYEEHEATNHSAYTWNPMACLTSLRQSIR
jgi:hypothetical protein